MFTNELTAEQRLSKATVDIMGNPKYVALAGVLMVGSRQIKDDCPTAYTNGRDEVYGRAFVNELSDAELRFLVLHENYHKLYKHLTTWKHLFDKHAQCANAAADYVINLKIRDDNKDRFAVMPECGLIDDRFLDMNTAEVFDILYEEADGESGGDGSGGDGSGDGDGPAGQSMDEHDWEGAHELTPDEQRDLAREIDEAIRQGAMAAGKLGSGGDRDLTELLQPQVDWREALREFINATCAGNDYSTWARPNRRYRSAGVYLPSGISEQVGELVVAIDTSGSIGQRELTTFLSEVQSICDTVKPECVRVLYWDTEICGDEVYKTDELDKLVQSTKPRGGGGTRVECVPKHLADKQIKPQACIILTDGYLMGNWGQWSCPTLWCVLDNRSATPDNGKVVHVKSRELR